MQRILASVSLGALFAASATAQCINISSPGTFLLATDETVSAQQALGLTYPNPVGGALAAGYTHCLVSPNGWIMLTDGVTTVGSPGTLAYGSTGNTATGLGGGAGSMPLLAPFWGDGDTTGALAGEGVYFKISNGFGPAEITFIQTRDSAYTVKKDFRVLIYDTGVILYQYSAGFAVQGGSARYIGVSTRNGSTVAGETLLGTAGAATTSGMCFRTFATGSINLADHEIVFIPDPLGGWMVNPTCGTTIYPPPSAVSVGTGCYAIPGVPPVLPMTLSVDPLPGILFGCTLPLTWTVSNVPEASHIAAGLRACNIMFSIAPAVVGGYDLGTILNIPPSPSGCNGYLFSIEAVVDVSAVNGTGICMSVPFVFCEPPSLIGLVLTTQAIALAPAGVYNGNTNDIGGGNSVWTSNAVQQTFYPF